MATCKNSMRRDGSISKSITLPEHHVDYIDALAMRDLVPFTAALRLLVQKDYIANGGKVGALK
ncbi:hypothetical protein NKI48_23820 [Mesorhizobium sp. M0644]|uniref:hypothetical protein n=1 Tax=Mesorhizobium sp. M0644 TaxID=2956979 RepID=UPI0033397240